MLGIDIVDLQDSKFKERKERSILLIQNTKDILIDHPKIFWLLWSAKEAVFKCRREAINFSPTSIIIHLTMNDGLIQFQSDSFSGAIEITDDYILAVCSDDLNLVKYQVIRNEMGMDSDVLRKKIKDYFKSLSLDIEIGSDDLNLPILLPSDAPISISHHGRLGAFAFPSSITD